MRLRLAFLPILLAAGLLASCGGGGGGTTVVVHKTVNEPAPNQGTTTTTSPATTTQPPAPPSTPPRHLTGFQLPSKNIGCYMSTQFAGNARCDIRDRSWQPPPKPARCDLDWGQGVQVSGKGPATVVCAGDTTLSQGPVLQYGQSSRQGPILCQSSQAGVTCTKTATGHGFFLSKQSYRLF